MAVVTSAPFLNWFFNRRIFAAIAYCRGVTPNNLLNARRISLGAKLSLWLIDPDGRMTLSEPPPSFSMMFLIRWQAAATARAARLSLRERCPSSPGWQRRHARNPALRAAAGVRKNSTCEVRGRRAGQLGWQKILVDRTANTNFPSASRSRRATASARHAPPGSLPLLPLYFLTVLLILAGRYCII